MSFSGSLPDTPETVIALHLVRRGLGKAHGNGTSAVWIHPHDDPSEPIGFGTDAGALWELLRQINGWKYPNVSPEVVPELVEIMTRETGKRVRLLGDVYHTLTQPPPVLDHPDVRLVTLDDFELMEHADSDIRSGGFGSLCESLIQGITACAIVDGQVVSRAHTYARTEKHADVGVLTLEPYRRRGYSAACAALVCREVMKAGQTPVWSCGENNIASLRTAAKLGFKEVSRRVYLIPETAL